jgi:hypothetical protein
LQSGGCLHLLFYRAADLHQIEWLFQNVFMLDYWQATFKLFCIYFKGSHDYYFGIRLDAQYRFCKLEAGHLWHPDISDDKQIAEGAIFEPRNRVDRIGKKSQLQISIS